MQISIDASTASPTSLRLTAAILTFIAGFKENPQTAGLPIPSQFAPPPAPVAPPAPVEQVATPPAAPVQGSGQISQERFENGDVEQTEAGTLHIDTDAQLDSEGIAWSPELHTANQSKNSDGTWRRKRTVKGEAAAPKVSTTPVLSFVPAPPPQVPSPPPAVNSAATEPPAPNADVVPTPPAVPAAPPAPPVLTATPTHGVATFAALVKFATILVGSKKISTSQLLEACAECGVRDINACSLAENLAVIPAVATAIQKRAA